MNKILAYIFTIVMSMPVLAQSGEYEATLTDGKMWFLITESIFPEYPPTSYYAKVVGDSTVEGTTFKKIAIMQRPSDPEPIVTLAYEKDGRIYSQFYNYNVLTMMGVKKGPLLPIIDFNKKVGDEASANGMKVLRIDYVETNYPDGRKLRRMAIGHTLDNILDYWIEGAGAGSNYSWMVKVAPEMRLRTFVQRCYDSDGFVFFDREDFKLPTVGISNTSVSASDDGDNAVYDLQGRRVEKTMSGHIYIKNKKKFIAR